MLYYSFGFDCLWLFAAPAVATRLSLTPSSLGGLSLSWTPPIGRWQSYGLLLFNGSQQLVSTALDPEVVNFSFSGTELVPGRMYTAVLRVESGGLTAESSCEGATGQILKYTQYFNSKYITADTIDSVCVHEY